MLLISIPIGRPKKQLSYFPVYKPRPFFKNFTVAAYIAVRLMWDVSKKPRTTHCTLRRASISTWSRSAHRQYFTITDGLCSRVATPPPPAVFLSLSLCMRGVSFQWQSTALQYVAAVYCTHRQGEGKLPPEVPWWARSSGPQVAVVISRSARLNASCVDRILPLFCQSSHHVYASEDVPTCKEITEEGATNTQVRLIYEFFPNFRQK